MMNVWFTFDASPLLRAVAFNLSFPSLLLQIMYSKAQRNIVFKKRFFFLDGKMDGMDVMAC